MSVITVEDAKQHMNVTIADDDALIGAKIEAAEAWIGKFIGSALDDADAFPDGTPEPLKEAVRQLVAAWYEQREAVLIGNTLTAVDVPFSVVELVNPYREWVF